MQYKGICPKCREMEWNDYESGDTVRCPKCETRVTLDMHPDLKRSDTDKEIYTDE